MGLAGQANNVHKITTPFSLVINKCGFLAYPLIFSLSCSLEKSDCVINVHTTSAHIISLVTSELNNILLNLHSLQFL